MIKQRLKGRKPAFNGIFILETWFKMRDGGLDFSESNRKHGKFKGRHPLRGFRPGHWACELEIFDTRSFNLHHVYSQNLTAFRSKKSVLTCSIRVIRVLKN